MTLCHHSNPSDFLALPYVSRIDGTAIDDFDTGYTHEEVNSRDLIKTIKADGWELKRVTGSHHHFKHPSKPGIVTVPHPSRDLPVGTLRSIQRQAGLKLR